MDAKFYFNRGCEHFHAGNNHQAIADYTEAIQLNPDDAAAYYNRGTAHIDLQEYRQAIDDFTKAIRLVDNFTAAYYNRGVAHDKLKKHRQAIADFTDAIRLDNNLTVAYNCRGIIHADLQDHHQAIIDYTNAIQSDDNCAPAYYNRGIALFKIQEYRQAIADYTVTIRLVDDYAAAYYNRGIAHNELEDYQQAVIDYTNAIRLHDNHAFAYYGRAVSYTNQTNYAQAQNDYTRYIFIGQFEYSHLHTLLNFFRDFGDAPFVVRRLLGHNLAYHHLDSYQSFLERIDAQCQPAVDCLDWLTLRGWDALEPERFVHFSALCQYFMGDTAEAYYLFDEKIDGTYSLSLMSHYYYVRSALFSARPDDSVDLIRKEALAAANEVYNTPATASLTQLYYAGMILYHYGGDTETQRALQCFGRAKGLLAAKYMLWLLSPPPQRDAVHREILAHEARLSPEKSFGRGLIPRVIGRDFTEYGEAMQHYCFYHEVEESIQGVHGNHAPLGTLAFYEYWQFKLSERRGKDDKGAEDLKQASEKDQIKTFRDQRVAEEMYEEVSVVLEEMKQQLNAQTFEESLLEESPLTIYERFRNLKQIADELDAKSQSHKIEGLLANNIFDTAKTKLHDKLNVRGFQFLNAHQNLALYFLATGRISTRATINLITYAVFTLQRHSKKQLREALKHSSIAGGEDDLKEIKESEDLQQAGLFMIGSISAKLAQLCGSAAGIFLVGFMVKTLIQILDETVLKDKESDGPAEEYADFLKRLDNEVAAARREGKNIPYLDRFLN